MEVDDMSAAEWNRVSRVGTPNVWRKSPYSKRIEIRVDAAPGIPGQAWQGYFGRKVEELGANAVCECYGKRGNGITAHAADEDDLARVIDAIDLAIEYANDRYESDVLPNVRTPRQREEQKAAEAVQSQAALDELAAKFAKPDRDTLTD
jgi:hypothetical protein